MLDKELESVFSAFLPLISDPVLCDLLDNFIPLDVLELLFIVRRELLD